MLNATAARPGWQSPTPTERLLRLVFALLWLVGALGLVGCGGGGADAGTSPFNSANKTPTLSLALSSTQVTASSSATVTATVRDGNGQPLSGIVVSLTVTRAELGVLNATTVLTDAQGEARAVLAAGSGGLTGADDVVASASVGSTTLTARAGYNVTGSVPTLQAAVDNSMLRASVGPVRFTALVRDAQGRPVSGLLVNFGTTTGAAVVSPATALTDGAGTAVTFARPADAASGLADTLVASATVSGRTVQGSAGVQVVAEEPSISLSVTPSAGIGSGTPATVLAVVRDASGALLPNAIVSFSSPGGLGAFSAATAVTAPGTGSASVVLRPVAASTAGADVVRASVTVAGVTRAAQQVVQFMPGATASSPAIVLSLSTPTVTPTAPAAISLQLLDGLQQPVPGAVVSLRTGRGNLANLSTASVLTNAQGQATATLSSAASGVAGADELVATAALGGATVQASAGFSVSAAAPTLQLALQPDAALRASSNPPATLTATLLDAAGQPQPGQIVRFEGVNGLTQFGASSAVTNSSGVASVTVRPASPQNNGAEVLRASATLAGRDLQATRNVDLVRESPSVELAFTGSSTATAAAPAGVRAVVRDLRGNVVPNAIVRFSTQAGLGSFSVASVATAGDGSATTFVSPILATTTGADTVIAAATVDGVTVSGTQVAQFAAPASLTANLRVSLSSGSISSASPATVTAVLTDSRGTPVAGQVIGFSVVRGLARTNLATSLTDATGTATVLLAPTSPTGAGADEVVASATLGGTALSDTKGFQINATNVTLSFASLGSFTLAEYGQTTLTLETSGASVGAPVNLSITSSCASQGKATISPSTLTTTTASVALQYRDSGCGALQSADAIQAVVVGAANSASLALPLSRPGVSSLSFVQALPEAIYLKGSGLAESATVTFEVRDAAGSALRDEPVQLTLLSGAGGTTMEGRAVGVPVTVRSDAQGRVAARVNSGTLPTPVRVQASITLASGVVVSTVSSNLSVAVGLPSQLNFSLAQGSRNIEGYSIDGVANTYSIIASDRSGNPVPSGTTINFVTEAGGSIEATKQTQLAGGIARATANFVSSEPRPLDGRITVLAYALGEESFIDLNGNNVYDPGEPFQDLGNIFKDRNFDGRYDASTDEFIPLGINNAAACVSSGNPLLDLDSSIPSAPGTCSGNWSGAGQVYVRRAVETVLSTSTPRPLWASVSGLEAGCSRIRVQTGPQPLGSAVAPSARRATVGSDTWYSTVSDGALSFIVADANPGRLVASPTADLTNEANWVTLPRLNPMAAGSTVSAASTSVGFSVSLVGGATVPSTTDATVATVAYSFTDPSVTRGVVSLTFRSPSGAGGTYTIAVDRSRSPLSSCAVDP